MGHAPSLRRQLCDARPVDSPARIGDTLRRPRTENTEFVQHVLRHLEGAGVRWAPRALGIDDRDREVVSWIPGATATSGHQIHLVTLVGIVRELHDLTAELVDDGACVIHDDLQPRNVVVRNRVPVGLIDWEQSRPGQRVEDVAKLCWSFIEPTPGADPVRLGARWRELVDAYGLQEPDQLVTTALAQIDACAEDIERGAARDSGRHQSLADRGDHLTLRAMHAWALANEPTVRASFDGSARIPPR
jgi:tRNA A-37 threonylcarbamoyl transferase component Bud32